MRQSIESRHHAHTATSATHVEINAGLDRYNLPTVYDFHQYPPDDVLARLYK